MHRELLTHSPLLVWPLVAMFVFAAVWLGAAIRAWTRPQSEMDAAGRMPLDDASPVPARGAGGKGVDHGAR